MKREQRVKRGPGGEKETGEKREIKGNQGVSLSERTPPNFKKITTWFESQLSSVSLLPSDPLFISSPRQKGTSFCTNQLWLVPHGISLTAGAATGNQAEENCGCCSSVNMSTPNSGLGVGQHNLNLWTQPSRGSFASPVIPTC